MTATTTAPATATAHKPFGGIYCIRCRRWGSEGCACPGPPKPHVHLVFERSDHLATAVLGVFSTAELAQAYATEASGYVESMVLDEPESWT